jgi:glutamate--cysteine ligase catalytic subunit
MSPILKENCIHLDGFGFAGGSCGLHVTLQVKNESEARWLHDQLIPLGPIMLALTASSSIHKGFLADIDVRWRCFTATVDEHTASYPKDVRHINDFIPRGT